MLPIFREKLILLILIAIGFSSLTQQASSQNFFKNILNPFQEGDYTPSVKRNSRQSDISPDFSGRLDKRAAKHDEDSSEEDYSDEDYDDDSQESILPSGRLLSPQAFNKISETLGALNTVGHFIVDMTRGQDSKLVTTESTSHAVPDAILTLTKNVLGQNVTKSIEPLIKMRIGLQDELIASSTTQRPAEHKKKKNKKKKKSKIKNTTPIPFYKISTTSTIKPFLPISPDRIDIVGKESDEDIDITGKEGNRCKTPDGLSGRCEDLSSCPALLLDLSGLRDSLCFKSLFVPGVCCPISQVSTVLTTQRPLFLTTRSPSFRPTQPTQSLVLLPQISPSTIRPFGAPVLGPDNNSLQTQLSNVVDPEDCGQQEYSSGRIVGGVESPNGQWPWLAAIFLHGPKKTEFWCGGSLVGTKYVLTAAHCTRDSRQKPFAARQFTVRLGDIDLSTDNEPSAPATFAVREVRAHERFSRVGFYNDIAILVLDRPVRKSKYIIPLCLPKPSLALHRERLPGRRATVVGWGTTYYGGKESTKQRQADLPVWRNEDCDRAYFQPINENFLCAGYTEGGVDACQGDSGGPLMMRIDSKWTQLGIVSFGNKCGEPGYPGVYTRVSQYLEWVKDHTKD